MEFSKVLRMLLLLALGQTHPIPQPLEYIVESLLEDGKSALSLYERKTSIPWGHKVPSQVGCIHEPKEHLTKDLIDKALSQFHCHMKLAAGFEMEKILHNEFNKIVQRINNLRQRMNFEPKECGEDLTCRLPDFNNNSYKKLEFGRNILVLYIKWMDTIPKWLNSKNATQE